MTALQIAFVLSSALSCWMLPVNPTVGVEVRRAGDGYVFLFRNCFDPKKVIGIHRVTVKKAHQGEEGDSNFQCRIVETPSKEPELTTRWTYGTTPPGYRMDRCEPLKSGETYRAEVSGAGGGNAVFAIEKDGNVRMIEGECK